MYVHVIIAEHLEGLNSTVLIVRICRIKFHSGVEFNFAINVILKKIKKFKKGVDILKNTC